MNNAELVSTVLGPIFLVAGASMLLYAKQWVKVIGQFEKNHLDLVIGSYLALIIGLIIVNLYNVWEWNVWLIVTVSGWLAIAKGVFFFLAPASWIKKAFKSAKCNTCVYFWGLVAVFAGAALSYYTYLV